MENKYKLGDWVRYSFGARTPIAPTKIGKILKVNIYEPSKVVYDVEGTLLWVYEEEILGLATELEIAVFSSALEVANK